MAIHSVGLFQLNKARVVAILTPHSRRAPPLFAGLFFIYRQIDFGSANGCQIESNVRSVSNEL
jgi:hypothetical protein